MKDTKKGPLTTRTINGGAILSGIGFLLYLAARALGWEMAADGICIVFGVIAVLTFLAAAVGRQKDKELVSYSLLWGTGALAMLLGGCAVLPIKMKLGLYKENRAVPDTSWFSYMKKERGAISSSLLLASKGDGISLGFRTREPQRRRTFPR